MIPDPNDPPWCLVATVGNGSKPFKPGTRVYCHPPRENDGYEKVLVLGLNRGSRWTEVLVPAKILSRWHAGRVLAPMVRARKDGFSTGWTKALAEQYAAELTKRYGSAEGECSSE